MPKHIFRLVSLILGLIVVALIAKPLLTAKSFYRFGHYRADSVPQIAAQEPVLQTALSCQGCHAARYAQWSASIHKINCEICHGPAQGHAKDAKNVKYSIPKEGVKLCTLCHEAMPGRPATQRQIQVAQHWSGLQCTACHSWYSPKFAAVAIEVSGDAAAGKARAAVCVACHGPEGTALIDIFPNLAGQYAPYMARILAAYRSGERTNVMMTPLAKALSDADIQNLAAYFASLSCKAPPNGKAAGDATAGKLLATNCTACHGEAGTGSKFGWPKLGAQNPGFQVNALKAYKTGLRKDPMMAGITGALSESDIANLAAYYAAQSCQTNTPITPTQPGGIAATPGTQPGVTSTQPGVASTQPSATSTQPEVTSTKPGVTGTLSGVTSTQLLSKEK